MFLVDPKAVKTAGQADHLDEHRAGNAADGKYADQLVGGKTLFEGRHEAGGRRMEGGTRRLMAAAILKPQASALKTPPLPLFLKFL
jgi:hypothetical protein